MSDAAGDFIHTVLAPGGAPARPSALGRHALQAGCGQPETGLAGPQGFRCPVSKSKTNIALLGEQIRRHPVAAAVPGTTAFQPGLAALAPVGGAAGCGSASAPPGAGLATGAVPVRVPGSGRTYTDHMKVPANAAANPATASQPSNQRTACWRSVAWGAAAGALGALAAGRTDGMSGLAATGA